MKHPSSFFLSGAALCLISPLVAGSLEPEAVDQPVIRPRVVTPSSHPTLPPSDAIVLLGNPPPPHSVHHNSGQIASLDAFTTMDGKACPWRLDAAVEEPTGAGPVMTVVPGTGSVISRHVFGDAQIHLEFSVPACDETHTGQDRGNSGVYLQGRYEVQVLDSYQSDTYPDGQCGAVYKQHAPLVNACLPPEQWQTYDIVFHAARFDKSGVRTAAARVTVLHNGVLIQDNVEVIGPTGSAPAKEAAAPGPLYLQDHGHPVRYRNIWVRAL